MKRYTNEFCESSSFVFTKIFMLIITNFLGLISSTTRKATSNMLWHFSNEIKPNPVSKILIKKYKNMDNKHMIDIIIKDAQEIESLTSNFSRYATLKVPPIYIDLTMSKVKNLYTELQMLNKQDDELFDLKSVNEHIVKTESTLRQQNVKPALEKVVVENTPGIMVNSENETPPALLTEKDLYKQLVQKREEHFLATQLKYEPIENIKEAIHLNEKIWFIKELFNGDIDYYNKTIDKLNRCAYLEEAIDHIDENFDWGYDNQTVRDFMEYVYRRFFN